MEIKTLCLHIDNLMKMLALNFFQCVYHQLYYQPHTNSCIILLNM
jgi:hypothetical protein